jgi:hypothetical protein
MEDESPPTEPDIKILIQHSKYHHRNLLQEGCFIFLAMRYNSLTALKNLKHFITGNSPPHCIAGWKGRTVAVAMGQKSSEYKLTS